MKRSKTDHITITNNVILIGHEPNAGIGEIKYCDMTLDLAKVFIYFADLAIKQFKGYLEIADFILKKFYTKYKDEQNWHCIVGEDGKFNIAGPVDECCNLVFVLHNYKINIFRH
jgi:hypothetical protein